MNWVVLQAERNSAAIIATTGDKVIPCIEFRPIRIDTASGDEDGRLIMADDRLLGVLVRLESEEQAPKQGYWFLEAGFGPIQFLQPEPFRDLDDVRAWIEHQAAQAATLR